MMTTFARKAAERAARHSAQKLVRHARIDPRRGWSLLTNPGVAAGPKFSALAIGLALTGLLVLFEVPLEGAISVLAPILGLVAGAFADGMEILVLPLLIACASLSIILPTTSSLLPVGPE
jgi:hypothetical protein